MPNALGDGVSFEDMGKNKWKIRWKEANPGSKYPRNRSLTMTGSALERDRIMVEVRDSLARTGTYDQNKVPAPVPSPPPPPCTVLDVLLGCIAARVAAGKYTGKTQGVYTSYAGRVVENIHHVLDVPETEPLPVTVLCRDLFVQIQDHDTKRSASAMMKYAPVRLLVDAWRWAHDANVEAREHGRPEPWPGLPSAPRSTRDYLPRTPRYGRTMAPTMGHIDACLRHFPPKVNQGTMVAALIMRYTGLRSEQVFSIRREDIDLSGRTLYVRTGKTAAEKADARTVPLAENLLLEPGVFGWIESTKIEAPLFPKRKHSKTIDRATAGRTKKPTETFRRGWEGATDAGEVPKHVWAPPNRKIARPEHGFRAAFQAFLVDARVEADVIDFLVGHEGDGVRETHYGRDIAEAARAAVGLIPPVVWMREPEEEGSNVVKFERG